MSAPVLTTKRLEMRAPTADDTAAYRAFYAASDLTVGQYRGGRTDAEVDQILRNDVDHWARHGFGMWLLRAHGDETVLGGAGLDFADDWQMHEVTWWLMPDARGEGFATEAARAAINWAYAEDLWPQVETYFLDENVASRRLAERLGGTFDRRMRFPDGIMRDIYVLPPEVPA